MRCKPGNRHAPPAGTERLDTLSRQANVPQKAAALQLCFQFENSACLETEKALYYFPEHCILQDSVFTQARPKPFYCCPGFGQDRVNFHRTPGRGTARLADPTWPDRAGYSIPCAVMLGSGGGELSGGNSLTAREHAAPVRSGRAALWVVWFVLCFPLICIVVVPVPFVCCSVKLPLS